MTKKHMRKEKTTDEGMSRRQFVKTGALLTTGALLGTQCFPKALKAKEPPSAWDEETDVLVIGTGYAGLAAAIEAHDAGAHVIILEKNRFIGGNSAIASGAYNAVDPERQKTQNIEDSIELHYQQTLEGGDYRGNPENVRYFVEHALEGVKWLEKMGVEFDPTVYAVVGALWPRSHGVAKGRRGAAIINVMKKQAAKRQIPILLGHKLTGLIREYPEKGKVLGVEVAYNGSKWHFKGKRAVVLATGGFGADVAMRSKYDPRLTEDIPTTNVATATGEAILSAADIGADVVGMDYIQGLIACNYYTKKYGSLANLGIDHAVFINIKGVRFVAEDQRRDVMAEATLVQPKKLLLWVADDRCKKRYHERKIKEILKKNLIFRADTIEALSGILKQKFNVPPKTFIQSINTYNTYTKRGEDTEFGKKKTNLKPLGKGPFWASPTQVGVHHTMGGITISGPSCQVMDRWGEPVMRLYAAGEVTGGIHGTNRLGGNATADCIVFGRTAGKHAASEKPWV